jgi:hypothetical protein
MDALAFRHGFETRRTRGEGNSGHFRPPVDLSHPGGTQTMMNWQFRDSVATSVHPGDKLPPEPLPHGAQLVHELERDAPRNQHIWATRVVDGNVENHLIKEMEESGKSSANQRVGTVHSPAQYYIAPLTRIQKLPEIFGIALSIGVQAEEIIGLKHVHTVADSARVPSPLAGHIQPQRQLLREARQDVLGVVSAAVFANDKPHVDPRRQFIADLTNGRFDTLAFIVNR